MEPLTIASLFIPLLLVGVAVTVVVVIVYWVIRRAVRDGIRDARDLEVGLSPGTEEAT
ncbi:hypothetical protein [Pengzhenrongella frigida]|uniref:hypothetical protein n=1 Tax=Pengzhenrongella frigida TaxID=1259133 RepID=UPI0013EB8A1C|nr:hypothetical protein [Cellulomonas sp. HLT2-17]